MRHRRRQRARASPGASRTYAARATTAPWRNRALAAPSVEAVAMSPVSMVVPDRRQAMASGSARLDPANPAHAAEIKRCCAAAYQSDWARLLLGDAFHPGGARLTRRLGQLV